MFTTGFAPYAFSENIVNSKLVLAFLDKGWSVQIISRTDDGISYMREWQPVWKDLRKITNEVTYPRGGFLRRLLDTSFSSAGLGYAIPGVRWARRALEKARLLHQENRVDFVISRSPNDVGHLPALAFCKEAGVPWIANWNDPPAHLWPKPYTHRLGIMSHRRSVNLLNSVCRHSKVVTFPSSRLAEHVCKSLISRPQEVRIVPHVGLVNYEPTDQSHNNTFRLCHAGNLSGEREPGPLLQGLAIFMAQEKPQHKVELEIIGVNHPETLNSAATNGIAELVIITKPMGFVDVLNRLSEASVLLLVEAPCDEGIFLPSKLVDYTQVGKPVLCISPRIGMVHDLLTETKGGLFADCTKPDKIAEAITHLYQGWKRGILTSEFKTQKLWDRFKPSAVMTQYERIFSEIKK